LELEKIMADNRFREALKSFGYGLYIVASLSADKFNGQLANTVFQVTSQPARIAAAISKNNLTHEYIAQSGLFSVSVVAESAPMTFIGLFGFRSGRVIDKFLKIRHEPGISGCPIVMENTVSAVEARVIEKIDLGTHTLFIGDIIGGRIISDARPMTYSFYQENLKGKTPIDSPTYAPAS
jgi:ferric-chelate reductase [NAD(P)H]